LVSRRSNWPKRRYSKRKGSTKLPPAQRKRIIANAAGCWFAYPGICTGLSGDIEIHHLIEAEDGGGDNDENLRAACKPCHTRYSAQRSAERVWDWKRKKEPHPGVLRDDEV